MTLDINKVFIVYPDGDFDGNASVIDAPSAKDAAYQYFFDRLDDVGLAEGTICVLPFSEVREFAIQAVETTPAKFRGELAK